MNPLITQAIEHLKAGRVAEAEPLLRRALAERPDDLLAIEMLGRCLVGLRRDADALSLVRQWAERGNECRAWSYLAELTFRTGDRAAAHAAALRALGHPRPTLEDFRSALEVLLHLDDFGTGIRYGQAALQAAPDDPDLRLKLIGALSHLGACQQAAALAEQSIPLRPDTAEFATTSAATALYFSDDPALLAQAHTRAGRAIEKTAAPLPPPAPGIAPSTPVASRTPRVLLISPDLRRHSVASFIEPLIRHQALTGLELTFLSTTEIADPITSRLRALADADRWLDIPHTDHQRLLDAIAKLQPDIIIECAGHTVGHSLHILAQRRAPLQLSYCGYAHDTGLPALDARLADAHTDPTPAARIIHLAPHFLCYAPPTDLPDINWSPAGPARPLTLGSFNLPLKLSDELLRYWSRLLAALPEARLRLKLRGGEWPATAEAHRRRFAALGLPVDRVDLIGLIRDHTHHLAAYDSIDIALDTFPYHGTTTTCEALLMGVPVVSRAGRCHHSRVGVSLLTAVGTPELIARSDDEALAITAALARDPTRLAEHRRTLRARLLASSLCDQPAFARSFGQTLLARTT